MRLCCSAPGPGSRFGGGERDMNFALVLGCLAAGVIALNLYTLWKARRAEKTYPPAGKFVVVDGVRLHYRRKGSGKPVVLLHGSDGFLQDYVPAVWERLARVYDVIAFDRPGHGYSDSPVNEPATP